MSDLQQHALNYYRQQQLPPGWADLFGVIVNGMMDSAGEQEGLAFLRHMGRQLAERYSLPAAVTVADLEREMNQVLSLFHWGCVDLRPYENRLEIYHLSLPVLVGAAGSTRWRMSMAAVLQGLYSHWLCEQGGAEYVPLSFEETDNGSILLFRYQH
ncbi:cellulose biosynthesis protein BcsD [Dickeya zeae]|uniref:cellulose biosynthesis protein BcsD n=1 Tax=Dickeya zeae TaxID=204042 RepID=UPI000C99B420|nr:cellulose biosynthesis protein BcsD [Dickeya zeae]AUQ27286.1 cellulose synthase [Dickeya zeae]UJR60342.1 cellulose synthase [Dickeya zeae]